jgi:Spy/CpxP family protein refolding chaperone
MSSIKLKALLPALMFFLALGLTPALAAPGMGHPEMGPGVSGGGPGPGPDKPMCPCGKMGKPDKMEMFRPEALEEMSDKIGADSQTIAKIKDLAYNANKELIGLRAEMDQNHLEMKRLMDLDSPDDKAIIAQIDKIGAVEIKLRKNRISLLLAVRKVLTPEQRTKLKQLMPDKMCQERGCGKDGAPCPGAGKCPKMKNMPPGEN